MQRIPQINLAARRFDPDLVEGFLAARRVQNRVLRLVALLAVAITCCIAYWVSGPAFLSKGLAAFAGGI
ncbi:MAG: hypothetical protein ACKVP3_05520 [Hyphomicrobiaceae bacterium]